MSAEENKALVRRWFAETDNGNLAIIDELLPPEYLDHNPPIPGLPRGREGVRQANLLLRAAFPDVVHVVHDQLAEGDRVMTRVTTRATFLGEFLGYPPTGNVVEIAGISVHRIAGGRLVEHWAQADMTGFMEQLGAPAGSAEAGDAEAGGLPGAQRG
jgi:predicted ester cyclase